MNDLTPEPTPLYVVCTLCGHRWDQHQEDEDGDVTTLECIRLLRQRNLRPIWPQPQWRAPVLPYITWTGNATSLTAGTHPA